MEMDFASMKRRELQALCKRHGLSAGGSNADLVARLSSTLSGGAAEERMVGVVVGKGCLKRSGGGTGGSGAAKTVTFVLEEEEEAEVEMETRGRGRRGRRPRVTWSPVAAKAKGRRKAGDMLTAAEGVAGEPGADAPRRRSRRNVANSSDGDGAACRTNSVNAEDGGVEAGAAVDRKLKRKQMTRDVPKEITVSAQDGVSGRRTRSSGVLSMVTAVQSPIVEKNRGRRRKADVKEQICLEVQEQPAKNQNDGRTLRSGSVIENPIVVKAAKVNVSGRTTRSSSVAAAMVLPVVLENKRKKKEHVHLDVELPFVPVVQANGASNTRSLRNRAVLVKDSVTGETHIGKKLEIRRQSCQSSTQHQQLASFVGEEDVQTVPAPSMVPELRRSRRRQSVANELLLINSNSEGNNLSGVLTDAKGLETAQPLMHNAAKTSMKDVVVREDENAGLTKRNTGRGRDKTAKNVGKVSVSESSDEALPTEMQLEVIEPLRRSRWKSAASTLLEEGTKGMHGSVRGDDLEKQPREKIPVRRSTRKSVVSAVFEKESNRLTTEMMPEPHVRRSKRKSFLPNMLNDENMDHCQMVRNEELKNSGKDAGKKLAIKEPTRRSRRNSVVPGMLDKGMKGLMSEMNSEVHVRKSTRKSVLPDLLSDENMDPCEMVRNVVLESSMGKDAGKKLATKEPSRQSTRKSVVSTLEKGITGLPAEMNPEVHVRRVTRKSVIPNMFNIENKYQDESVRCVADVAVVKQLEAKKPVRSNEGGLKLGKRRRTSMEMSCSSSNNTEVSDRQKSRRQQKAQTPASKARPAKKSRTDALQKNISFEEPNAEDMVIRESRQDGDEDCHEYCNDSSASIQDVNKDNATIEELSLAPLLVGLPTETRREQWVNAEVHGSDSGDADKQGENPEFCHLVAMGRTHQCEEAQEYGDFRTGSIHLSGISSEELGQSSSISELVSHAGISSENKALLDDAEADLGATITQTLNADSNEEALGELRSVTALPHLETEARTDDDVNSNGVESSVDIQDVSITLPDQLIGALTKLPIVDELPLCTSDALVIVNDSHACNVANWTAVKGTEDIQNVDIASSDDGLEAFKSMTVAEEVQSCTAATVLEDGTLADGDFERTCMKNSGASLSLVDSGSSGNQTDQRSFKSLEFKLNHLPTVNDETRRQSNEGGVTEVASQQFDNITVTVAEYDFSCQNDTNSFGDHQPCSVKINGDDFSLLSGRSELEPLDIVPVDWSADDNEEASPVTEGNSGKRENSSESTKKSLSDTMLSDLHTQDCRAPGQLVDMLAKETREAFGSDVYSHQCSNGYEEADKHLMVHSDAAAEKSNQGDDLCKYLSTVKVENPLATNLHVEDAAEDKSMLPIPINAEWGSSDGRHSSSGLKSLFAEEGNRQRCLIDDQNIAVKVDSGNKLSDGRHSSFGLKSLFAEESNQHRYLIDENISVKVDSGNKSSDGRRSSFGLKSFFAEEGNQRCYMIDDENIAIKVDSGNKSSDGRHSSFGLKSLFAEEGNQQRYSTDDENIAVKVDGGNISSDGRHSSFGLKSLFAEEGNQRRYCRKGSSTAEQSSSSPRFMSLQESMEETMGYSSLAFAVHSENRVDESNDFHMEYNDDQTPVPEQVADHGTDVDSVLVTENIESNENHESPKASHEEQDESGQFGLFKAANYMEATTCQEVAYEDEENCGHVDSTDINTPCEKSDDNGPSKDAKGNSDALLSCSVIVPASDNDVHLSGNISQLESTVCLDEPTLFFNVGVHQSSNEKCNKHKEDQVPSGVCTSDIFEPANANGLQSGLMSLPANEISNLQDDQFNSELESTQVVQSGISCAENSTNILEFSFTVNAVDKETPSDPSLPKDCPMDHYEQHELLDDIPAEKSLEASAMCLKNSVLRTGGTAEKPAINLASPDSKLQEALSSPNPKHSPFGLPFLFSEENMDGSRSHDDVVFPCAENKVDESNVSHVKCRVEKTLSPEPGLCEGSHDNLGNAKEIGSCISSCQQGNEQEEFSEACHEQGWVASVELDSADDVNQTEREIISSEVVCEKEEKMEVMSSDIDAPVRESHASELAAHVSPVSKTQICDSRSSPICDEVHPSSKPSELESPDVFHQDREVLCSKHNEDQDLPGSSGFSEAVSFKFPEIETMSLEAAETSALLDEKLNPKPECDELEEHNLSCVKDAEDSDDAEFVKYSIFRFPADGQIDSCQEMELPNDQSASKACEESALFEGESVVGTCETSDQGCLLEISAKLPRLNAEMLHQDHKEENNEHKEDELTPCIPTIDMSGDAPTEGPEGGITLLPDAELSAFTDVRLKSKLENNGDHNFSCDKDSRSIFYNTSVDASYHEQELLNDLSSPKCLLETTFSQDGSVHLDSYSGQAIPEDMPRPKSPDDYQDDSVSGSVADHGSGGSRTRSCCTLRSSFPAEAQLSSNSSQLENDLYNEDQATPCVPASDMSEPAPTSRTEQGTSLLSASETSVFKEEQLNNPNLVSIGGHSHEQKLANDISAPISLKEPAICQEDSVHYESCPGQVLPEYISAPKSPEEPSIHQDDSVPGSAGMCQTSGRRRIDEISTKLLSFKISSTVKPSHIAMNTPSTRQVDNLSQSAIALLRNRENTPAIKTERSVKPNPDRSVAKNSSRRPLQPISRRPEGH